MAKTEAVPEIDPVALSQEPDYRLRSLERAVMLLLAERVMTLRKQKMEKADFLADAESVAQEIAYTIDHYPDPEIPS